MTQWRCTTSLCRAATNLIEVGVLVAVNIILYTVPDSVHLSSDKHAVSMMEKRQV